MQETGKMDICSRLLKIEWQASSQADLLTETDPVRLRNVSELGGSGLDGGLGGGLGGGAGWGGWHRQRLISAKTCRTGFLLQYEFWIRITGHNLLN